MKCDKIFIEKINKKLIKYRIIEEGVSNSECYGWSGATRMGRTPNLNIGGRIIPLNRAAWMAKFGEIPKFHFILLSCNNKFCTNPEHLILSRKKSNSVGKSNRIGRKRMSLDFPAEIVDEIKKLSKKYNMTLTRYVLKRFIEIIEFEQNVGKSLKLNK